MTVFVVPSLQPAGFVCCKQHYYFPFRSSTEAFKTVTVRLKVSL